MSIASGERDKEGKFTLQISELGGVEQFISTGQYEEVMGAYEKWAERVDRINAELRKMKQAEPEPTPPAASPAGSGKAVVVPLRRPS